MKRQWGWVLVGGLLSLPAWGIDYAYDTLNRLTQVRYDNGTRIDYAYDAAGNMLSIVKTASATPSVQLSTTALTTSEAGPTATITLTRTGPLTASSSVTWTATSGTAILGSDFGLGGQTSLSGVATFAAGAGTTTFIVRLINDAIIEGNESFNITLSSPVGASLGANTGATVTIADNDAMSVNLAPASLAVVEGAAGILTVTRSGSTAVALTVPWSIVPGSATAVDYTGTGGTLSFAVGATSATISVPTVNDTLIEGPETFQAVLGTPSIGGVTVGTGTATVTITDNDSLLAFAGLTATVAENAGNLVLTVTRTGSIATAASITWSTANGTALAGTHFGTAGSPAQKMGTVSWPAGDGAAKTITIPILNVATAQGAKTFTVNLGTASGATLDTANKTATITITDQTRSLAFAATTLTVNESAGNAVLTVNRTGNASGAVSVNYATVNGTATSGADFGNSGNTAPVTGTLNWPDGDSAPKSIVIPVIDDTLVEASETFSVALSAPTGGASVAGAATASVTLTDNDSNLQFSTPTASISERLGSIGLTVTRTGILTAPATVVWTATNGSASAGSDYGALGNTTPPSGTLNFAANVASQTLTVPILTDAIFEGNENFTVTLSAPSNATLGTNPIVTVSIVDDEAGVQFERADYTVAEGTANIAIKVLRVGPAGTATQTVKWTAANGSATAGQDYGVTATAPTGTLTWAAGDVTAKTITIPIINDLIPEADETLTVTLSNPTGGLAFGAPTVATVTIWDNDSAAESTLELTQAKVRVAENAGNVQLSVSRTGDTHRPASVNWAATNGTALAGSDYGTRGSITLPTGALTWAAGDNAAQIITIPILEDTVTEPLETFKVTLSGNSVSTTLGTIKQATVVIEDRDEVFPPQGQLPAVWTVPADAQAGWHVAEDTAAAEGKYVLKTDTAFDNESAKIQVTGTFAAGSVSFKLKVSSEEGFDFLRFYIDGVKMAEWSGNLANNWTMTPAYPITAGVHTLTWAYEKDATEFIGQDAAWIDAVTMPVVTP